MEAYKLTMDHVNQIAEKNPVFLALLGQAFGVTPKAMKDSIEAGNVSAVDALASVALMTMETRIDLNAAYELADSIARRSMVDQ
jgi:hypothetical protein